MLVDPSHTPCASVVAVPSDAQPAGSSCSVPWSFFIPMQSGSLCTHDPYPGKTSTLLPSAASHAAAASSAGPRADSKAAEGITILIIACTRSPVIDCSGESRKIRIPYWLARHHMYAKSRGSFRGSDVAVCDVDCVLELQRVSAFLQGPPKRHRVIVNRPAIGRVDTLTLIRDLVIRVNGPHHRR